MGQAVRGDRMLQFLLTQIAKLKAAVSSLNSNLTNVVKRTSTSVSCSPNQYVSPYQMIGTVTLPTGITRDKVISIIPQTLASVYDDGTDFRVVCMGTDTTSVTVVILYIGV